MCCARITASALLVLLVGLATNCEAADLASLRIDEDSQGVLFEGWASVIDNVFGFEWSDYIYEDDYHPMLAVSGHTADAACGNTYSEVFGKCAAACVVAPDSTSYVPQITAELDDFNSILAPDSLDFGELTYSNRISSTGAFRLLGDTGEHGTMQMELRLLVNADKDPYTQEATYFYIAVESSASSGYRTGTWIEGYWWGGWYVEGVIEDAELGATPIEDYIPSYSIDETIFASRNVTVGHEYRLQGYYRYAHTSESAQASGPDGGFEDIVVVSLGVSAFVTADEK